MWGFHPVLSHSWDYEPRENSDCRWSVHPVPTLLAAASHHDMCVVDHIAPRYNCPYNLLWNCPFFKVISSRAVNIFPEENSRTFKQKDTKGANGASVNYLPSWNTTRSVRLLMGKECCFSHTQGLLYKTKQKESSTYECISTHFKISYVRVFLLSACDIEEKHRIFMVWHATQWSPIFKTR